MQRLVCCDPGLNLLQCSWRLNQILNDSCPSFYLVYGLPGTLSFGRSTYLVSGHYLLCSSQAICYHPPVGPWHRKRHFEANNVTFLANKDDF